MRVARRPPREGDRSSARLPPFNSASSCAIGSPNPCPSSRAQGGADRSVDLRHDRAQAAVRVTPIIGQLDAESRQRGCSDSVLPTDAALITSQE